MKADKVYIPVIAVLAIGVGFYPFLYLMTKNEVGLLSGKSDVLLSSALWMSAFYLHIIPGGIALLIGWPQFVKKLRNRRIEFHRALGKIYLLAILTSGVAGLYLAFYAEGGAVAQIGFLGLAISWLFTTTMAYITIKQKKIESHQNCMIRSYALCFAAVTLRIWLPLFTNVWGMDFIPAYRIIAWLAWVPNLLVAELIVRKNN